MKIEIDPTDAERTRLLLKAAEVDYNEVETDEDRFYNSLRREDCKKAADRIFGAFVWGASKEGQDYWVEVHKKLSRYGRE